MPEEIEVSCPGCSAIFVVSSELCGEMAECTECSAVFEIPKIEPAPAEEEAKPEEPEIVQGVAAPPEFTSTSTNTVKLSRSSIGMIPSLKESFTFGGKEPGAAPRPAVTPPAVSPSAPARAVVSAVTPPRPPEQPPLPAPSAASASVAAMPSAAETPTPTRPFKPPQHKPSFVKPAVAPAAKPAVPQPAAAAKTQAPQPAPAAVPAAAAPVATAVKIPAWTKVHLLSGEDVYAVKETKKNPVLSALLVSLPPLLSAAGIFLVYLKMLVPGLIVVGATWLATFIAAIVVMGGKSKTAVILTSHRAISVSGSEKVEAKK